jgi:hypothetical protein
MSIDEIDSFLGHNRGGINGGPIDESALPMKYEIDYVRVYQKEKKIVSGTLNVEATFNNTKVALSDKEGNVLFWTSAGSLGFKGAKKGTPFAASKASRMSPCPYVMLQWLCKSPEMGDRLSHGSFQTSA